MFSNTNAASATVKMTSAERKLRPTHTHTHARTHARTRDYCFTLYAIVPLFFNFFFFTLFTTSDLYVIKYVLLLQHYTRNLDLRSRLVTITSTRATLCLSSELANTSLHHRNWLRVCPHNIPCNTP